MSHQGSGQRTISRRSVLTKAVEGAGAFTILNSSLVRGAEANSKIELGVVGCGGRGAWIAGLFARNPGYHISAVADYFADAANRCGDALGVAKDRRFSGLLAYKRLIESKVDAIALETPPCFFPEHASAAVAAGLHVYMAKPVACDVPGTLQIGQLGRRSTQNKRVFMVDFQMRTDPFIIECVKRVHDGAIGKIGLLSSYYDDEAFADPPKTKTVESRLQNLIWVNDTDIGASYLVNAGIHAIDCALWVANSTPASCIGASRIGRADPHGDSHDVYSLSYEFADGLILNHRGEHMRNLHEFNCGVHAYGQGAWMEANYNGKAWLRGGEKGYRGGDVQNLYEAGAVRNIETFRKCVVEGNYENPTVEPSVNSTLATILGREAALTRSKVTWADLLKSTRRLEVDLSGLTR